MTHRNHHEREFEAFLAGEESELARLYRRLPQSEPDPKLDAAVLAMARAAVEPQRMNALRHAKDKHRRPLWVVGLSSAAGVVLAAGLAWQMRGAFNESLPSASNPASPAAARSEREVIPISAIVPPPEPATAETAAIPPPALSVPMPPPAPAAAPAQPAPMAEAARSAPRAAKATPHKREVELAAASADKKDQAPRFETTQPQEPPAAAPAREALADAATDSASNRADGERDLARSTAAPGSSGARPQAFPATAPTDYNSVERKAAIASGTRRDDYGLDAEAGSTDPRVQQEQRARQSRQVTHDKGTGGNGLAAKPASRTVAADAAPAPVLQETAPAPAAASTPASTVATGDADKSAETELQRNARLAPDEWIKKIRELLRAGRRADAIKNVELLRERHPDHVLPDDLRTLHP
ncbi:MAG TPA: hypothetical protein VLF18_13025 [Tahibacter sp.]|uniref:hypothetical protein n=1 Tax=Tahibacter sp. TaxID=2056211 RepID=UPI002CA700FD|nr:hypothetical protein [Tahibacter sp.]HSX61120.1 hypothetical protein [Tahibacter sp.]